ncbi:SRPBCC family protein [Luedemannella helvata]|uniref:SRPBCC family protein n=1 Tax=Luedemannella helvata TaxID=349315 RepID=A0ABN2KEU4_9ACTN
MSTITVSRTIAAPVDVAWAIFTDLPGRPGWLSTVDAVEVLTPGPFGAGVRWRETRKLAGDATVTEELVVAEVVPRERCVITSPGAGVDYELTYTFRSIDVGRGHGGTTVGAVFEGHPSSRASRMVALFLGGLAARTVEGALRRDLDALAAACADPMASSAA